MSYLLGIDIGTSGTKTILFDLLGNVEAYSKYYKIYTSLYPSLKEQYNILANMLK